jgi:PIN domain nuclease of toxin-antitoxin system
MIIKLIIELNLRKINKNILMFSQISFWELNVKTNAVLRLLMDSFNSKS